MSGGDWTLDELRRAYASEGDNDVSKCIAEIERLREQLRLTSIDQATTEASENEAHDMCNTLRAEVERLKAERAALFSERAILIARIAELEAMSISKNMHVLAGSLNTTKARVAALEAAIRDELKSHGPHYVSNILRAALAADGCKCHGTAAEAMACVARGHRVADGGA